MSQVGKFSGHLATVLTHKYWVGRYCFIAGIPIQGIFHDMSKFSPIEFFESVHYYTGTHSPIDECKKRNGMSYAWLHHRGRNKHHYEYWIDNLNQGGVPIAMPYKYALEMICDFLGAGQAYNQENFSYMDEAKWWFSRVDMLKIHPQTKLFVGWVLLECAETESADGLRRAKELFLESRNYYKNLARKRRRR